MAAQAVAFEFSKLGQNDYAGKEFDDIVDAKEHLVAIWALQDPERVGITVVHTVATRPAWGANQANRALCGRA